ncbi:MAG: GTP cyclohydrolase II [Epsilonproteobacteria bacterium]|nr:GTP cyclohydrolase II [Campylobacterota bacterium]
MDIKVSEVAKLPTENGLFYIQAFKEGFREHLAIFTEDIGEVPIVRVHSECLTGDVFGSKKCDCGEQLEYAKRLIARRGGLIVYHRQEGRNIGLLNKVNAYALQDGGLDTVEANHQLGFKADERTYDVVEFILNYLNISRIRLLTNNPKKLNSIRGVEIVEQIPIRIEANSHNSDYLKIKREKLGHLL